MLSQSEMLSKLAEAGRQPKVSGNSISFRCPFHERHKHGDKNPSASAYLSDVGNWRFCCFAGCCEPKDLEDRLGLSRDQTLTSIGLPPSRSKTKNAGSCGPDLEEVYRKKNDLAAAYTYVDAEGRVVQKVVRLRSKKTFRQEIPDPSTPNRWRYNGPDVVVIYRLPEVINAVSNDATIFWCEGEKDADTLNKKGFTATTSPGGSNGLGRVPDESFVVLKNADVVILPDNDETGRKYASQLSSRLESVGVRSATVVDLYGSAANRTDGRDVTDWLNEGNSLEDLRLVVNRTKRPNDSILPPVLDWIGPFDEDKLHLLSHRTFAALFARHNRGRILHSKALGWCEWTGTRWAIDQPKAAERLAKEMGQYCREWVEKLGITDPKVAHGFYRYAKTLETANGVRGLLDLAKSESILDADKIGIVFDDSPNLLTCPNGTVDLFTGEIRECRAEDYITKLCPTHYVPKAQCPRFKRFLQEIFIGDLELARYVLWLLGYGLTGLTDHHLFVICHGDGANGKTTLLRCIESVLGSDYAHTVNPETFLQQKFAQHGTERAALRAKRMVIASETPRGRTLNEAFIKELSGGEVMTGRFMRRDEISFKAVCKAFLMTNDLPLLRDSSDGMRRRLRVIPFKASFTKAMKNLDPSLPQALAQEHEGILALLIGTFAKSPFAEPDVPEGVKVKTSAYLRDNNPIDRFIEERCIVDERSSIPVADLFDAYETWGKGHSMSKVEFGKRLAQRLDKLEQVRKSDCRIWKGISIRSRSQVQGGRSPAR